MLCIYSMQEKENKLLKSFVKYLKIKTMKPVVRKFECPQDNKTNEFKSDLNCSNEIPINLENSQNEDIEVEYADLDKLIEEDELKGYFKYYLEFNNPILAIIEAYGVEDTIENGEKIFLEFMKSIERDRSYVFVETLEKMGYRRF